MKKLCVALFAMLLLPCFKGQAQVGATLRDQKSGEPVMFANVALLRLPDSAFVRGTTSDATGAFSLQADGGELLRISAIGYKTLWLSVNGLPAVVNVPPAATTLAEVAVVDRKPLYAVDGEKTLYNTSEDPSVQTGTASDVLQNAPGVSVDAEGNITLRGASSVEIWINDRPSHMNEEALKQYIKTLPANAIDQVEVITNPSARYSSSGGVINIVTNQKVRRNELLCVGAYGSTMPSVSPWVSYVWANDKVDFNIYLNGNYSEHNSYADGTATLFAPNGDTSRHQSHHDTTRSRNRGGYAGLNMNWNISDRTHLSAWLGAYPYWGRNTSVVDLDYKEYAPLRDLGYRYDNQSNGGRFWGGYAGAWLEHRFDSTGRKLSLSLNGNTSNNYGGANSRFAYHNPLTDTLYRYDSTDRRNRSIGLTLDYVHPLRDNWELAAGMSTSYGSGEACERLDTMAAGSYRNVLLRSYLCNEQGTDLDFYATLQKRWGGLSLKAGLRGEWVWMGSTFIRPDGSGRTVADTHYFAPVPSLHLSYQTKTFASYSLSYTRRYANPGRAQINPFVRYDDYSYYVGNPALRLTYAHNIEAAWSQYLMGFGMLGLSAYYKANTNEVGTVSAAGYAPAYFAPSQLVYYTYPDNIGSSHTEGLEANITYRPTAMFNLRLNASAFNYGYNYNGVRRSMPSWSASLNVWAKLWSRLELFATAHYTSSKLSLYTVSVPNKGVNLGLSSDFFERKLSVYLNVNDIFGMAEWGDNTDAPAYQTTGSQRFDSRFVSFGITWRLGKMELEAKARQGSIDTTPQGM